MKKTLTAVAAGAALLAGMGAANAATCTTKYLTGMWVGQDQDNEGDGYCIVQFKSNGWVVQASCFDGDTLKSEGTWDGRFTATKDCKVTGNFDFIPKKGKKVDITFSGKMNPNTGVITGTMKTKGEPNVKYTLVEQWN